MPSISAANATVMLAITGLFPAPQQLQGFAADDIFDTDPVDSAEVMMGVDGKLSAGFVFREVKFSVSLQADSPSNLLFDNWHAAMQVNQDIFFAQGVVQLTAINTKWAMVNGVLTSYPPIPNAGKLLRPRKFGITWESVSPAIV